MIHIFILLGIAFVNIVIGALVFLKNQQSPTNRAFSFFTFGVALWVAGIGLYFLTEDPVLIQFLMFGAILLFSSLLYFVRVFPTNEPPPSLFYLLFIPIVGIAISIPFNIYITDIANNNGILIPVNGPGMPVLALALLFYVIVSFVYLVRIYRKELVKTPLQHRMLIIAIGMLLVCGVFLHSIFPFYSFLNFDGIIPASTILFTALAGYSILKHRLFDIRLVLARTLLYAVLISIFAVAYSFLLLVVVARLLNTDVEPALFGTGILLISTAIILFQPLRRIFEPLTTKIFYKSSYATESVITDLTRIIASTVELQPMSEEILNLVMRSMGVGKSALLLVNHEGVLRTISSGYDEKIFKNIEVHDLFNDDFRGVEFIITENIQNQLLKSIFTELDIALAIPVKADTKQIGLILIGPKLSGETMYSYDINLLVLLAEEASIAIQKATTYEEVQQLNEELEQRVEERTKELKETQKREIEKAQDVAKLKDEFVFIAAHELRAPITAIRGFLQIVSMENKKIPADVQKHLATIALASDHLHQLINDLLEVARSEVGTLKIQTKKVNVTKIIKEVVQEVQSLVQEKQLTVHLHDTEPVHVLADESKLKEVVMNLVSNAIKYNKPEGKIDIQIIPGSKDVTVNVRDTGYGIPKRQQSKIFQKFFRAETKETRSVSGTGLGLFITRVIIEKMQGTISFSSIEGKGSTFAFTLLKG